MNLPNPQTDAEKAKQVLQDALTSSGLPQHVQVAIWCAADSYARCKSREAVERIKADMEAAASASGMGLG